MVTPYRMCLVTVGNKKTAERLASGLVKKKLAACVSVTANVTSYYTWRGKMEKAPELLLLIKTRKELMKRTEAFIRSNHPYDVPEILFLEVAGGNADYLKWLNSGLIPDGGHNRSKK